MIKTMKYTNMVELKNELSRSQFSHDDVNAIVKDILDDVKLRGDQALYDYNKKFDNVSLSSLQVTEKEIEDAFNRLDKELLEVIRYSHENIVRYHTKQKRNDFLDKDTDGVILGQIINPIEKVGIYVPGGTAAYPSTV
ncbi:MAG: histidinol dehydrogenase, partial [Leptotrichiaceae bacterium]|nr:histidinol dehydrogenase [Leptotrichiaceae bacterium]